MFSWEKVLHYAGIIALDLNVEKVKCIIASDLNVEKVKCLVEVLKRFKRAIG